jgi:hypothetical protein
MTLTLLNFALAPLAVLVAVPLLVHLFARSRPPRYSFSSLEFLQRAMRKTMRIQRPRDWLLLALRTLLAALLIGAFLRPVFRSGGLASPFERRNIVVVIDRSASMAAVEGGRTRFSAACAEASELLAGLTVRDMANVIWLDAAPDAVFPELGVNAPALLENVRHAAVSYEDADIERALELAASMLAGAEGAREIDIVSDFQAAAWRDVRLPDAAGAAIVNVAVCREPVANIAVSELTISPAEPLPSEPFNVTCSVWNYSDTPARPTLFVTAGEIRRSRELFIQPWSSGVAQFELELPADGLHFVSAECTEDAFPSDNACYAVVQVRPFLRAGMVGAESPTSSVWARALRAFGLFRVEQHASLATAGGRWDALLLSGWDGTGAERLREIAGEGGVVICAPGAGIDVQALAALASGDAAGMEQKVLARRTFTAPQSLVVRAPEDPVFSLFSQGAYGDPARGLFRTRLDIPPVPGIEPLLAFPDGTPALASAPPHSIYIWNLDLGDDLTDWHQQAAFLPLFGELLLRQRGGSSSASYAVPGMGLRLDAPPGMPLAVEPVIGMSVPLEFTPPAGQAASVVPRSPGVFAWRGNEALLGMHAVNLAPVESDLRALPPDGIQALSGQAVESGRMARDLREGIEWWPWLIALAAACFMIEGLALWRWEGVR